MPDDYNSSYTGPQIDEAVGSALNPDTAPTQNSDKLITSGGVYGGLSGKQPSINVSGILKGNGSGGISAGTAGDVPYDNAHSSLTANNVQSAIDELAAGAGGGGVDPETIAPVEESTTATVVHPLGSIFYLNDILYRAIADIPVGGTINTATGGNATQTTIAQNFKRTVTLTSAEYAQLSIAEKTADIVYIITDDNSIRADDVSYDNETSGASATNVQDALDEAFSDVQTRVPVNGMGKNLLRNWYFVGGGTGHGVFPVNQRGQSSYRGATFVFDGWTADANTSIAFGSTGITVSLLSGSSTNIYQRAGKAPLGQSITMSILTGNGLISVSGVMPSTLPSNNQTVLSVGTSMDGYRFRLYLQPAGTMYAEFRAYTTQTWVAGKLELGTEQTVAHQENGGWVLNEIPDYEYELYRCITSTADPSDTYANKSLATRQDLTNIQATGTTNTTGAVIPAGAYFYLNGILHRAKTQIAVNATFTVNTNCEQVPEGGLNRLNEPIKINRQVLATSVSTGLNTLTAAPDAISGYKAIGVVGVQFASVDRTKISLAEFLLDGGTYVTVQFNSTYTKASGCSVYAFVIYAKE